VLIATNARREPSSEADLCGGRKLPAGNRAKQSCLRPGRILPERHADVEFSWNHTIRGAAGRNRTVDVSDLPPVAAGKAIPSRDAADFALGETLECGARHCDGPPSDVTL